MSTKAKYTIGFSNLTEQSSFCVTVRESLEAAAKTYDYVNLICRDNAFDDARALANAKEFADVPVDLAIVFHINERLGPQISNIFRPKQIPIIAVDVPILWATYFGIDNRQAGTLAADVLAKWILANWNGKIDKVLALTETRVLDMVKLRTDSAIKTLSSLINFSPNDILYLDCGHESSVTLERTIAIMERWLDYHRIAVIGFNEDTTMAVIEAVRQIGREADVVVVGQSADNAALQEIQRPDTRLIASTSYRPQAYGTHLIDLALRILEGQPVPDQNFIEIELLVSPSAKL
jgi:ribose transport system substrate-binding protein